ncbi:MAG TPA: glycosyltransferase [Thermoanaerobaculia bacterium]|nr:glycosyltransferase [Thermoanaerobaculia bacterium]
MSDDGPRPALSVVIPAYDSHDTLAGCLEALERQTFRNFETIVVDSGPDGTSERIVAERFPWVRFERSARRLLPHAARNRGVELARAELIVFTDPDIYARPGWLERLLDAYRATGEVVVGALACHGDLWRDQGIHLCKFSKWLPGGRPRSLDMSPTANMLIAKKRLAEAGGLPGDEMLGDVVLSRGVLERGGRLWFEPRAVVEHHHLQGVRSYLRERYTRGKMFGEMRAGWLGDRRGRLLLYLAVTVLPVRLARILALVGLHAGQAGQTGRFVSTLPLMMAGHGASLAGEAAAYARRLALRRGRRTASAGGQA